MRGFPGRCATGDLCDRGRPDRRPCGANDAEFWKMAKKDEEKPVSGVVIVGNNTVAAGNRVLFSKYGYDEMIINKEVHYVVSDATILGIFD